MDFLSVFGYFDQILLLIIIFLNFLYWKKFPQINGCIGLFILLILFGAILPIISIFIEIKLHSSPGDDAFNLLYNYFKFPIYWVLGILEIIIFLYQNNKKINEKRHPNSKS